jgi:hypothetical protein
VETFSVIAAVAIMIVVPVYPRVHDGAVDPGGAPPLPPHEGVGQLRSEPGPLHPVLRDVGGARCGAVAAICRRAADARRPSGGLGLPRGLWGIHGESTLENWQSEFLQLFSFVVLAAAYIHRGSAESRDSEDRMEQMLKDIKAKLEAQEGGRRLRYSCSRWTRPFIQRIMRGAPAIDRC